MDFFIILFDFSSLPTGTSSKAKLGIEESIILIFPCICFWEFSNSSIWFVKFFDLLKLLGSFFFDNNFFSCSNFSFFCINSLFSLSCLIKEFKSIVAFLSLTFFQTIQYFFLFLLNYALSFFSIKLTVTIDNSYNNNKGNAKPI